MFCLSWVRDCVSLSSLSSLELSLAPSAPVELRFGQRAEPVNFGARL